MAINDEHVEYTLRKTQWEKLRDCADGQEAVHGKKTKYLPKLSDQTDAEYNAYRMRTLFYGATARTIDGLSGMVFRKEPQIEAPEGLVPMLNDVNLSGLNLMGFAEQLIDDDITVGRFGIMVDHPSVVADTTVAQAEADNLRPFLKHYTAENIFNWRTESRNNANVITQVRLWETVEIINVDDEFDISMRKQIRILDFNEEGQYRQRVFIENKQGSNGSEWIQDGDDIIPMKAGKPLDVIPFFFGGVKNGDANTEKPPLIDLVNANLSHYITTADLEHGAHFTGLPTAVVTGHTPEEDDDSFRIGAATAWVFPNPETQAFYLEFEGQGLGALENRALKKEEYMAFLGARMLTPDKKAVETAETAQIHRLGETSVLSSLAQSAGQSIEDALQFMSDWAGFSGDVTFTLNNDFLAVLMNSQDLTALLATWQAGGMAFGDFLDNLKRGEIIREDRKEEDIVAEIETETPFGAEDFDET